MLADAYRAILSANAEHGLLYVTFLHSNTSFFPFSYSFRLHHHILIIFINSLILYPLYSSKHFTNSRLLSSLHSVHLFSCHFSDFSAFM